jgi:hypothetical protein
MYDGPCRAALLRSSAPEALSLTWFIRRNFSKTAIVQLMVDSQIMRRKRNRDAWVYEAQERLNITGSNGS